MSEKVLTTIQFKDKEFQFFSGVDLKRSKHKIFINFPKKYSAILLKSLPEEQEVSQLSLRLTFDSSEEEEV